tara:strand:- start:71 stop:751 length:681 start_codon:yes stop_codon:yes gene_type:complete
MNNLIKINKLNKKFKLSNNDNLLIFENLDLNIDKNSITSIIGPSGCGKSTLLNILGLLDSSYNGDYIFNNQNIQKMRNSHLSKIRNRNIGFIHQFFYLIPELSVLENIKLPALINNSNDALITSDAIKLLETLEIDEKQNMKPNLLSGGEQQRVAIARSLINKPELILADEMTGNLDESTSDEIIEFFLNFIKKNNLSLIYVTHNSKYAEMADFQYELKNKTLLKK